MAFLVSRAILSLLVVASLVDCFGDVLVEEIAYIYLSYSYGVNTLCYGLFQKRMTVFDGYDRATMLRHTHSNLEYFIPYVFFLRIFRYWFWHL